MKYRNYAFATVIILAAGTATLAIPPSTLYVAKDGNDVTGDGSASKPFRTIQKGIDTSADGCTVIVRPGTYTENIHFHGKDITLISTNHTDQLVVQNTIIDGNDANSVATFSGNETNCCVLSGFTITHGKAPQRGGIYGNGTRATVTIISSKGTISCPSGHPRQQGVSIL